MERRPDPKDDDDFNDIYKEYTGPPVLRSKSSQERALTNKRSHAASDEEEEPRDPNAVPTDFTSREAKVWEAKSKATERNWKKRKEEEMICKICGESGHFTQGCPSTLGANRKSKDFFERVAARDKHVRVLFTEKVIDRIEKDVGCKIQMDEKFLIVSGKDRLILAKGVDAVHKVIKEEGDNKVPSSQMSHSRSPQQNSSAAARFGRSDSQKSFSSPRNTSQFQPRFNKQEKAVEDHVREDLQRMSRGSPQGSLCISIQTKVLTHSSFDEAYGNNGVRGRLSHSKSPAHHPFTGNSYSFDRHNLAQSTGAYRSNGCDTERQGANVESDLKFDYPASSQSLEELELEYKREVMNLGSIRDKEEDEEIYKHREAVMEIRESYMKKLASLRGAHAQQWEEFLQLDAQRRQHRLQQQFSAPSFGGYKRPGYSEYDSSAANPQYAAGNLPGDTRGRYPNSAESYPPSRAHDTYSEFQRQRRGDLGKSYHQF